MAFVSDTSCDIFMMLFCIYLVAQAYPWFTNTFLPRLSCFTQSIYHRSMNYCYPDGRNLRWFNSCSCPMEKSEKKTPWRLSPSYQRHKPEKRRPVHNPATEPFEERYYSSRNFLSNPITPPEFVLDDQGSANTVRIVLNGQPLFIIKTEKKV